MSAQAVPYGAEGSAMRFDFVAFVRTVTGQVATYTPTRLDSRTAGRWVTANRADEVLTRANLAESDLRLVSVPYANGTKWAIGFSVPLDSAADKHGVAALRSTKGTKHHFEDMAEHDKAANAALKSLGASI